jgi:hypothetical protein
MQQFYGMLAFAKAIVLAFKGARLSTLPRSHGVTDASGDACKIENLQVTIGAKGVFQEANDHTRALNRINYFGPNARPLVHYVDSAASASLTGMTLSLRDLLSRIPGLQPLYRSTFGAEPNAASLMISLREADCEIRIDDPQLFKSAAEAKEIADRWRSRFPFLKSWAIESAQHAWGNSLIHFLNVDPPSNEFGDGAVETVGDRLYAHNIHDGSRNRFDFAATFPPFGGGFGGHLTAVAPFNGLYISEFSLHYLTLFLLSTLVRYSPERWMAALTRSITPESKPDDRCLALIEQFLSVNAEFVEGYVTRVLNPLNDRDDQGLLPRAR